MPVRYVTIHGFSVEVHDCADSDLTAYLGGKFINVDRSGKVTHDNCPKGSHEWFAMIEAIKKVRG